MAPATTAEPGRAKLSSTEFYWSSEGEPHAIRRKAILAAHPELKQLFGPEPLTFPIVVALVLVHTAMAGWAARSLGGWQLVLLAWTVGGFFAHALFLAGHEISHNLAFHTPLYNTLLGVFSSLPGGFASFGSFVRHHMIHHASQGVDGVDMDLPDPLEVRFFGHSTGMKLLNVIANPIIYGFRPLILTPMVPNAVEVCNLLAQVAYMYGVYSVYGGWAIVYLYCATLLGLGLHPVSGHFYAEHYTLTVNNERGKDIPPETYSYLGPLNWVAWNVGYHVTHHDLANKIAWSRLPRVREMAPEFYDGEAVCDSWPGALWTYITDPRFGPNSRVKRKSAITGKRE